MNDVCIYMNICGVRCVWVRMRVMYGSGKPEIGRATML